MRFLVTMNMPSSNGHPVHQVIFDHSAETVKDLYNIINDEIFICGRQFYKRITDEGRGIFVDRGAIILNTAHIGKIQEYVDHSDFDESRGFEKQRAPLRSRNNNY